MEHGRDRLRISPIENVWPHYSKAPDTTQRVLGVGPTFHSAIHFVVGIRALTLPPLHQAFARNYEAGRLGDALQVVTRPVGIIQIATLSHKMERRPLHIFNQLGSDKKSTKATASALCTSAAVPSIVPCFSSLYLTRFRSSFCT